MIETVIPQVYSVLDKYDKSYGRNGVTKNLNRWMNNKGWLVELLRRHSNWNEEALAVIFEVTQNREIDRYLVDTYKSDLFNIFRELDTTEEERNNFYLSLDLATGTHSKNISNDNIISNIKQYTGVPCSVGQKTSRVINKICQRYDLDKHPEYNSRFARLADSLNPLRIKRKALLSVHPCDYLEMSNRLNSWTSCHCLDDGAYHGGTLSYMNDECSMIFYTVDDDVDGNYYEAPKRSRQVFCFNSGILLQSRLYPNTDDEEARNTYRNIVQLAIADCLVLPNLWTLKREQTEIETRFETYEDSLHYPDYDYECYKSNISILKDAHVGAEDYILIGHTAYCLSCSDIISENNSLYCDTCGESYYTCQQCGARIREDDLNFINDGYYCDDCCSYCEHCQEYTLDDTTPAYDRNGNRVYICSSCRQEDYSYCEDCEEYYYSDNGRYLEDGFHCDKCLDKHYYKCGSCGEYIHYSEAVEVENEFYCASCAEDLAVELEEKVQSKVLVSV